RPAIRAAACTAPAAPTPPGRRSPARPARCADGLLIVALTGGIGAGKSTVAELLRRRGATVIDVDALGRAVLEPGGRAHDAVVAAFGPSVVDADGRIDRAALARVVFSDPTQLRRLTAISHPAINADLV